MITMASLEELQADGCVKLKNIRQGLVHATRLGYAYVSRCSALEELPSMEALVSLEKLGCSALEELPGMEALGSLEKLAAEGYLKKNITRFLA